MTETVELKRTLRASDLSYLAAKKRQSPRTGFVHLFHGNEAFSDTIPLYENFCYVLALLSQKKAETVLEAKKLLSRLFPFQGKEGNFPIYLHDFPHCYDIYHGLKIAPLLLKMQKFKGVLGSDTCEAIDGALRKLGSFYEDKKLAPLWKFRHSVCFGGNKTREEFVPVSASDWWEYWVSLQFIEVPKCTFYHAGLQMAIGFSLEQDRFNPAPRPIDWICCENEYLPHLLHDRATQIQLIALDKVEVEKPDSSTIYFHDGSVFWKDSRIHSLVPENISNGIAELPSSFELGRDDLFEAAYYCDAPEEIELFIDGQKGTVFALGQTITIQSETRKFTLKFELLRGEGEFCGHIFRSNRPGQIAATGAHQYDSFDWKIAIRTLRRSPDCALKVSLEPI